MDHFKLSECVPPGLAEASRVDISMGYVCIKGGRVCDTKPLHVFQLDAFEIAEPILLN